MTKLLNPTEASIFLGVKKSTLAMWRCRKKGPNFVKVGFLVRYTQGDLEGFLKKNRQKTTEK